MLVFVDTNILIYHLEAKPDLGARASARLAALHAAGDQVVVSDLVRLDCRVGPLKSGDDVLLASFDGFFSLPGVQVAGLTPAVCDRAASIRAAHGFRTPDALNLAAAVATGCGAFLTNDARLAHFTGLTVEVLA